MPTNIDHIRIYQDHQGEYRWAAIAANHETVAEGESHTRIHDAVRAATSALGDEISVVIDTDTPEDPAAE